jgi:hypothetical protein
VIPMWCLAPCEMLILYFAFVLLAKFLDHPIHNLPQTVCSTVYITNNGIPK